MDKEKSEKKSKLMFFLSFASFSVMWFIIFYFTSKQIYNDDHVLFYGLPIGSYMVLFMCAVFYGIITWAIYVFIKDWIRSKSLHQFKLNIKLLMKLAMIPLFISLPFLYLGMTNAIVITKEKVIYDTFWSFTNEEYFWDKDIKGVEIDYFTSKRSKQMKARYFILFDDGKKFDIWEDTFEGNIDAIKEIDSFIQKKGIPFFVKRVPSEQMIDEYFSENADFIRELFSR